MCRIHSTAVMGPCRCEGAFPAGANVAHIRKSRPDSGCGVEAEVLKTFYAVLSPPCTWPVRRGISCDRLSYMCTFVRPTVLYAPFNAADCLIRHVVRPTVLYVPYIDCLTCTVFVMGPGRCGGAFRAAAPGTSQRAIREQIQRL